MQITLSKANKIRNKLNDLKLIQGQVVRLFEDRDYVAVAKAAREAWEQSLDNELKRKMILHDLRQVICQANARHKIDEIMGKIDVAKQAVDLLRSFGLERYDPEGEGSVVNFERAVEQKKKKEAVIKDQYVPIISATYNVLTDPGLNADMKVMLQQAVKEHESLIEQRNKLNFSVQVEIPEDMAKFLREHNLI